MVFCAIKVANRMNVGSLSWSSLTLTAKPGGIMENMVIDDRLLFFGSLFISLSATQFLL